MSLYPSFARPKKLSQAMELLDGLTSGVALISGGQELMPHINYGALQPDVFVDLNALPELRGISEDDGHIVIGAATVHREIQSHALIQSKLPLLAYAATRIGGGRQVHNRGTIGGNIVAVHPLYDILPSLLALDAEVELAKQGALHRMSVAAAIKDPQLGLGSAAILVRLFIRPMPETLGWSYEKLKNSGGAYGSANAAALVACKNGKLETLKLVIGAVADRLIDASSAVAQWVGQDLNTSVADQIAARCVSLVEDPLDDQQGPAAWRRAMAGVIARRAVVAAARRAGKEID